MKIRIGVLMAVFCTGTACAENDSVEKIRRKIETCEKEQSLPMESPDVRREGQKPLEQVDVKKLVGDILADMGQAREEMKRSGTEGVRSIQDNVLAGIGVLHANIISDINKLIDYAKQVQIRNNQNPQDSQSPSDDPANRKPGETERPGENRVGRRAETPYDAVGTVGEDDVTRKATDADRWGVLPEKERDKVMKASVVGELEKYSRCVREYFDRLERESKKK